MTLSLGVLEGSLNYFRDFVDQNVGVVTNLYYDFVLQYIMERGMGHNIILVTLFLDI